MQVGCGVFKLCIGGFVLVDGDDAVVDFVFLYAELHGVECIDDSVIHQGLFFHDTNFCVDAVNCAVVVGGFFVAVLAGVCRDDSVHQIVGELAVAVFVVVGGALTLEEAEHFVEVCLHGADVALGICEDLFVCLVGGVVDFVIAVAGNVRLVFVDTLESVCEISRYGVRLNAEVLGVDVAVDSFELVHLEGVIVGGLSGEVFHLVENLIDLRLDLFCALVDLVENVLIGGSIIFESENHVQNRRKSHLGELGTG